MCSAAYPGASVKKKGIEIEPRKWDLVWAACDLRGTLVNGAMRWPGGLPLQILLRASSLS